MRADRAAVHPFVFRLPAGGRVGQVDTDRPDARHRAADAGEDRPHQVVDGVAVALDRRVARGDRHVHDLPPDGDPDLLRVDGHARETRQGPQTVVEARARQEQVVQRSTGPDALARVEPDERVVQAAFGALEQGEQPDRRNAPIRVLQGRLRQADTAGQRGRVGPQQPQRVQQVADVNTPDGRTPWHRHLRERRL
jgi:hypothetical protein